MSKFALILAGNGNTDNIERSLANVFERKGDNYETFVASAQKPKAPHDHYAQPTLEGIMSLAEELKDKIDRNDELVIYVEDSRIISLPGGSDYTAIANILDPVLYKNRVVIMNKVSDSARTSLAKIFMDDPMTLCISTMGKSGTDACEEETSKFWGPAADIKDLNGNGVDWQDRLAAAIKSVSPDSACKPLFTITTDRSIDFIKTAPVLVKAGRENEAVKIFQQSIATAEKTQDPKLFREIAPVLIMTKLENARQIFLQLIASAGKIQDRKNRLWVLEEISTAITKRGLADINNRDFVQFLLAVGDIKNDEIRFLVLKGVTSALVELKKYGLDAFEKFVSVVAEYDGGKTELRFLIFRNIAFNLAGYTEYLEQFIAAVENAESPYFRAPALREIASSLAKAKLWDKAAEVFKKAIAAADKTSDEPSEEYAGSDFRAFAIGKIAAAVSAAKLPDIEIFGQLLYAMKKIGDPKARHSVFSGILENFPVVVQANNMDPKIRSQLIEEIISAQNELAQNGFDTLNILFAALDKIENPSLRCVFFRETACELAKSGQIIQAVDAFQRSIATAKKIENPAHRSTNFVEIASSVISLKEKLGGGISPILDALLAGVEGLPPYIGSLCLMDIALKLAVAGIKDKANKVFEDSFKTADKIEPPYNRSVALVEIASKLTSVGFQGAQFQNKAFDAFLKSIAAAEKIADSLSMSSFFGNITSVLAKERPTKKTMEKTIEIFKRLIALAEKNFDVRTNALLNIDDALKKLGLQERVSLPQ